MKKNTKRKLGAIALVGLVGVGASAWLTNQETATGVNKIKMGNMIVVFDNEETAITLSDETAIPMTRAYAMENLTSYKFTVDNDGAIDALYTLSIVAEDGSQIDNDKIHVDIVKGDRMETKKIGDNAFMNTALAAGESHSYEVYAYIDENAVNADVLEKSASFHLELNAIQPEALTNNAGPTGGALTHADVDADAFYMLSGMIMKGSQLLHMPEPAMSSGTLYEGPVYLYTAEITEVSQTWEKYADREGITWYIGVTDRGFQAKDGGAPYQIGEEINAGDHTEIVQSVMTVTDSVKVRD